MIDFPDPPHPVVQAEGGGKRLPVLALGTIANDIESPGHGSRQFSQGLEQQVIDVVKYDRPVTGLAEKDQTMITFGRTLLREHKVSSELWAKMVALFSK